MKLLTKTLEKRFEKMGSQDEVKDPIVIAKFFNPTGTGTWLATEYDPETKVFYGIAYIHETEWGSFSLKELSEFRGLMSLGIERELNFVEAPMSEVLKRNNLEL